MTLGTELDDLKLTGWLVFYRFQSINDMPRVSIPIAIREAMVARGWMRMTSDEPDFEGDLSAEFTEKGLAVSDMAAPEWGLEIVFDEGGDAE